MSRAFATLFLIFIYLTTSPLAAEPFSFEGKWKQIASNAGACENCTLLIEKRGRSFLVTANNGWSATVTPDRFDGQTAEGRGQWGAESGGTYKGQPFQILVAMTDSRQIWIGMSVKSAKGRKNMIKAIFDLEQREARSDTEI